jgi:gluconokinase
MIVVVMGVSGAGKTRVGRDVAGRLGWTFIEGDELHTEANRGKMAAGTPLTDEDRWPWLERICAAAREIEAAGGSVVVACSALKRSYRDRLRTAGPDVRFVHLTGERGIIAARMAARRDHYMPPGLLDSQIATLEVPGADEGAMTFDVSERAGLIIDQVAAALSG